MNTLTATARTTRVRLRTWDVIQPRPEDPASRRIRIVAEARRREARARIALARAVARAEAAYELAAHELEQLDTDLDVARARLRHAGYIV